MPFYHLKTAEAVKGRWLLSSGAFSAEGCVAVQSLSQQFPCGFEFVADEAQAEKPSPHRVFGVFVLLGLGACGADFLCQLAQCQAKLNVALEVSGVKSALALGGGGIELEKPELNRAFGKGGVEVEHMVSAVVVVLASAVGGVVACVPNVCQLRHRGGLLLIDLLQEPGVNRPAVPGDAAAAQVEGYGNEALVACHNVDQVAEGLRGVSLCADVDVDSAASSGIALGSGFAKLPEKLLQSFHIAVGEDRGNQFAFFNVRSGDADILLEFPFPTLLVPSTPGGVAVAVGGIFVPACAEVGGGKLGCLGAGDAVHFNLDPDGLLLHFSDLLFNLCVHFVYLRVGVFPFGSTHIRSTSAI